MKLKIFLVVLALMCFWGVYATSLEAVIKRKPTSMVLIIINNIAKSKHNQRVNKMMNEAFQRKIDGLYDEEAAKIFLPEFIGQDKLGSILIVGVEKNCKK